MASITRATTSAFLRHSSPVLGCVRNNYTLPSAVVASTSSFLPSTAQSTTGTPPTVQIVRSFSSSASEQYYQKKQALKDIRTQRFAERQAHKEKVKRRRDGRPKNTRKKAFNAWFMAKKRIEEISDRRAKKLGLDWKIQVAVVLERLPVVLPDKADWERDYDNLRTYLDQFGRDYPEALMGKMEIEEIEDLTDEAILGTCVHSSVSGG